MSGLLLILLLKATFIGPITFILMYAAFKITRGHCLFAVVQFWIQMKQNRPLLNQIFKLNRPFKIFWRPLLCCSVSLRSPCQANKKRGPYK